MSRTVFREDGYRFYVFSREEERPHVHVYCADGEAKFWILPDVALARNAGLSEQQLVRVKRIVEEHHDEIARDWNKHFGR
jgi:hypothetical protein